MNNFKKIAMTCAGLLLVTTSSFAEISQKQAKELLDITNTYTSMEEISQTITDPFVINKKISAEQKSEIIAISDSFHKGLLIELEKDVAQNLDEEDYNKLIAWYNTDQRLLTRMSMDSKEGLKELHNLDITEEENLEVSDERRIILDKMYNFFKIEEKRREDMNDQINKYMELIDKKAKEEGSYDLETIVYILADQYRLKLSLMSDQVK